MSRKIWTAAELEAMSPAEVDALFRQGIVWDLNDAPQGLIERTREKIQARIEQHETTEQP